MRLPVGDHSYCLCQPGSAQGPNESPTTSARASGNVNGQTDMEPPPSFSVSSPSASTNDHELRSQPGRDLDGIPLEEPPPYTPSPSLNAGETTVESGPARPFQPPPPRGTTPQAPPSGSRPTGGRSGSLFQQLSNSLNNVIRSLEDPSSSTYNSRLSPQPTGQNGWSSYPGQQQQPPRPAQSRPQFSPPPHPPPNANTSYDPSLEPPPRHPLSRIPSSSSSYPPRSPRSRPASPPTNMRRHSSEFAHDFYAAGTGDFPTNQGGYAPPPGPPPALPQRPMATGRSSQSVPNDGRPTSHPIVGHPLLKDGKVLVYPKGYECEKCNNVGYKAADPLRPCKRCWNKYAKPFAGPLAYSFNNPSSPQSASPDANFQRPLPYVPPPAPRSAPPAFSLSPPQAHFAQGGYMSNRQGGFYTPPLGIRATGMSRPPPGSVIYTAGDPRIGGRLCWRCDGRGNVSFLFLDRETCPVCGGVGRTFD
ncbi:hypothetical protein BDZ97DRAFT_1902736 [Flammula alnicola]|nr:hypothetical protein BDZ97DRAFT_1902736 [Flammula alnicola]